MHEKIFLAASFGASSLTDDPSTRTATDSEASASTALGERTVLMFLGGLLGGLMILSLGFVALVSYEGFHTETAPRADPAAPD